MSSHSLLSTHSSDVPTDFERFIAEHRGLQEPEAKRLLVEWVTTYQPQRPRPLAAPHATP